MIDFTPSGQLQVKNHSKLIIVVFLILLSGFTKIVTAETSQPRVLILNAYHQGEDWSDKQINGILSTLKNSYPYLIPSIEHLDSKRYPGSKHLEFAKDYLKSKYQGKQFDLIMTLDNNALTLMLKFRHELFTDVPIVFAGVNGYRPEMLKNYKKITGVAEVQDMEGTLKLALKIHPDTKTVLAVHDHTSSGLAVLREMKTVADKYKSKVTIEYTRDGAVDDLVVQLKALNKDAIVMLLTYVTDKNGKTLTREESTRLITSSSPVPVYAMHETRLGYGIVGGMLLEGTEHGKQAAEIALKILSGIQAETIKVSNSLSRKVFDYNQIQRFQISLKDLPPDSVIINQAVSFFKKYKSILIPGSILVSLLILIVAILILFIVRIKKVQEALQRNEIKYRTLFENMVQGVFYQKADGVIFDYNPSVLEIFGLTSDQFIGKTSLAPQWKVINEDGSELSGEQHPSMVALKEGRPVYNKVAGIFNSQKKDFVWVIINAIPQYNPREAKPYQVFVTMHEITELKQAERKLRQSEKDLKASQRIAHLGSWRLDLTTNQVVWTEELFRMYGFDPTLPVPPYTEHMKLFTSESWEKLSTSLARTRETGIPYELELETVRADKSNGWMWVRGEAVKDSSSNTIGLWGAAQDITERKQEAEKYKKTIESSIDGFWINGMKGEFLEVNEAYSNMIGYNRDELLKMSIMDIEAIEHPEETKKRLKQMIKNGSARFESKHQHKKGHVIDLEISSTFTHDNGGMFYVFLRNITEKKQMEERLRQAQKMESIGNLAGGIAHDFNNLLYPILGFAEILKEDLPSDSSEHESAQEIFDAGKRGRDLVKQILAFSRQSEHKMAPVRIQNVLKEVLRLSRSTIPSNIDIQQNIQQNCGLVMADSTQIHQVAMNLITNAFHAIEEKNGVIHIALKEITIEKNELPDNQLLSGKYVRLSISDNGIGMSKNTRHNIFEPYFTTKEKGKGTGLGLAMVYGIVKEHAGDIKVYSELGEGSTFNIYLPLMEKTSKIVGADQVVDAEPGTENILLVDDEASIAKLEGQILSRLGYRVTVKTKSSEALNIFKMNPDNFDLVITDMTMPDMTGDRFAQEILSIKPNTPIIICTGFSERINKERVEIIGVKGFIMKPVLKSVMAQMVRRVLDEAKNS